MTQLIVLGVLGDGLKAAPYGNGNTIKRRKGRKAPYNLQTTYMSVSWFFFSYARMGLFSTMAC